RHHFAYDGHRRKTAMIYPDGTRERWSYDATGRLATYTTRAGQVRKHIYDGAARLVRSSWSPAGAAPTIIYEYDAASQLKAADDGLARLTYTYDRLGRRLTETTRLASTIADGSPRTIAYTYDVAGRRTQIIYPDGSLLRYTYNSQSQLATITRNGAPPLA